MLEVIRRLGRPRPVLQMTETECGAAALVYVMRRQGISCSLGQVSEQLRAGRDGVSIRSLINLAKVYGVELAAFSTASAAGIPAEAVPLIAHQEDHHFVVVDSVGSDSVEIMDPEKGSDRVSFEEFDQTFTGLVVVPQFKLRGATVAPIRIEKRHGWKFAALTQFRKRSTVLYILKSLFLGAVAASLGAIPALLFANLLNESDQDSQTWVMLASIGGFALFLSLVGVLQTTLASSLRIKLDPKLSNDVVERMMTGSPRFFNTSRTGDIAARIASAAAVRGQVLGSFITLVIDVPTFLFYLYLIYRVSIAGSITVVGLISVAIFLAWRASKVLGDNAEVAERDASAVASNAVSLVSGFKSLRSNPGLSNKLTHWQDINRKEAESGARVEIIGAAFGAIGSVIGEVGPLLLLAGLLVADTSLGDALFVVTLATSSIGRAESAASVVIEYGNLQGTVRRLDHMLDASSEYQHWRKNKEQVHHAFSTDPGVAIALEDLSFSYSEAGDQVLSDLSIGCQKGQLYVIAGESGSGKSTLVQILAGLLLPEKGRLLYGTNSDGQRLRVASVFQESAGLLVGETVAEMIGIDDSTDDHRDASILWTCDLEDVVASLPLGLRTPLGEGGSGLSGGQLQRVAIANALQTQPDILILDEVLSGLDGPREAEVLRRLRSVGITIICASHRQSVVATADAALVLDEGRRVGFGSPVNLATDCETFSALFPSIPGRVQPVRSLPSALKYPLEYSRSRPAG